MSTVYHVFQSDDFKPDEGGSFGLAGTYNSVAGTVEHVVRLLNAGRAVQIEPDPPNAWPGCEIAGCNGQVVGYSACNVCDADYRATK